MHFQYHHINVARPKRRMTQFARATTLEQNDIPTANEAADELLA